MTERDERFGKDLRDLEVPEHRPGFQASLRTELERSRVQRRRWRRLLPPPRWGLGIAAATAAVVVLFIGIRGPGGTGVGPPEANAARIGERIARALREAQSLEGVLVVRDTLGGGHTLRWSFALRSNGDFRMHQLPRDGFSLYRAQTGVETTIAETEPTVYGLRRGLAPGPPDEGPTEFLLQRDLGALVRALVENPQAEVREGSYRGREVWIVDLDQSLRLVIPEEASDHVRLTVDQETGLPLRVVETDRGRLVGEIAIENPTVNSAVPADFTIVIPAGSRADRSDVGFRPVPLEKVSAIVDYEPLLPTSIPAGYRRAETAVARETFPTAQGRNPISRGVVSTAYRRGLDRFIVTTRLVGEKPGAWGDPLFVNENVRNNPTVVRFTQGVLAGRQGRRLVAAGATPHVWALTQRLVVSVSGDLSGDELFGVANALEALRR